MELEDDLPVEKLVKIYVKLNERLAMEQSQFAATEREIKQVMAEVKSRLLTHCNTFGVESVRTSEGLFYRTVRTKYWTNNWDEMGKFVVEHNVPDLYEKRLHQGNVKQFLEENPGLLPPGLNVDSEYSITVKKK